METSVSVLICNVVCFGVLSFLDLANLCCVSSTQKGLICAVVLCGLFWCSVFLFSCHVWASSPSGYCSVLTCNVLYWPMISFSFVSILALHFYRSKTAPSKALLIVIYYLLSNSVFLLAAMRFPFLVYAVIGECP